MTTIGNKTLRNKISFSRSSGKRTSIGRSCHTKPKSKHTKRDFKKYRGQGFP